MKCQLNKRKNLCKKTQKKNTTSTKLYLVLVFFCLGFWLYPTTISSYSIQPAIEEYTLELEQEVDSSVNFTNTTEQEQNFKIYTHRYNPEKQEILDDRNFVTLSINSLSLEPEESAQIEYRVSIPDDVVPGSYFSIIVVEDINDEDIEREGGIGLNYGVGTLIAIHVIDDVDISEVFLNQTHTELKYKRPLNPFNTVIEYSIRNNSKYTFLPMGQLTIASKKDKPLFYRINEQETRLYPQDKLTFEFEYKGNLKDLITNKIAVAKVASEHSNEIKETQIDLPYLTQTLRIGSAILGFVVVLTASIILIKKSHQKRLEKAFKEKFSKKS